MPIKEVPFRPLSDVLEEVAASIDPLDSAARYTLRKVVEALRAPRFDGAPAEDAVFIAWVRETSSYATVIKLPKNAVPSEVPPPLDHGSDDGQQLPKTIGPIR